MQDRQDRRNLGQRLVQIECRMWYRRRRIEKCRRFQTHRNLRYNSRMNVDDLPVNDECLRWDRWRLTDGTFSMQVTHLPTGIAVYRQYDSTGRVQLLLGEMRAELQLKLSPDAS
jgi:hypothetical protein